MRALFHLFLIASLLYGCSATNNPAFKTHKTDTTKTYDDQFEDEFSDEEFDIKKVYDPLSGYNRFMTGFNDLFFEYVLDPIATAYAAILHEEIRKSIGNFIHNLLYPLRAVNNLLQLKFANALEETARFGINSTIGLLGLFDPAKKYFNLEAHEEDFGQTLGFYGVGSGFHIVLPFLGPSNLRDALSLYPDAYASPFYYYSQRGYNLLRNSDGTIWIISFDILNDDSLHLEDYANIKKDAVDLYPYLRDIYEQHRNRQIKE